MEGEGREGRSRERGDRERGRFEQGSEMEEEVGIMRIIKGVGVKDGKDEWRQEGGNGEGREERGRREEEH